MAFTFTTWLNEKILLASNSQFVWCCCWVLGSAKETNGGIMPDLGNDPWSFSTENEENWRQQIINIFSFLHGQWIDMRGNVPADRDPLWNHQQHQQSEWSPKRSYWKHLLFISFWLLKLYAICFAISAYRNGRTEDQLLIFVGFSYMHARCHHVKKVYPYLKPIRKN